MSFILKKKFGQNFLIDNNILNKIHKLIPYENLNILEIGPGNGKLTDKIILKKPHNLTLVEIDKDLIEILIEKYTNNKSIDLINEDILNLKIDKKYDLVISNLPYNISSQILVKFTTLKKIPKFLIFMFQKEFAERIVSKKLNSLNSLVNCFYDIGLNFKVSRNCFRPIPKVDSTVLSFHRKKKSLINKNEINNFIKFKGKLFSQKRKSIRNVLKKYDINGQFDLSQRIENLELKELIKIFRNINF